MFTAERRGDHTPKGVYFPPPLRDVTYGSVGDHVRWRGHPYPIHDSDKAFFEV